MRYDRATGSVNNQLYQHASSLGHGAIYTVAQDSTYSSTDGSLTGSSSNVTSSVTTGLQELLTDDVCLITYVRLDEYR